MGSMAAIGDRTMNDKERYDFIQRLGQSSIMAVFEAASKMLDMEDDRDVVAETMDSRDAFMEDLSLSMDEPYENWEGMPMCEGFDAFEEDPDDFLEGKKIGIPRNQLIVSSPFQGMLKPSPFAALFVLPEDY